MSTNACSSVPTLLWYPPVMTAEIGRKSGINDLNFLPFGYHTHPHPQQQQQQQNYASFLFPNGGIRPEMSNCLVTPPLPVDPINNTRKKLNEPSASKVTNIGSREGRRQSTDPFAPECLIPLPSRHGDEVFYYEPVFLRRRNERERQRVRCVNDSYSRLRQRLPLFLTQKRMSKVEILRSAIAYIRHLQDLLESSGGNGPEDRGKLERYGRGPPLSSGNRLPLRAGSRSNELI